MAQRKIGAVRDLALALALTIVAGSLAPEARAAEVMVVDSSGQPASSAMVACLDPPDNHPVAIAEGRATVPSSCRRVRCENADSLPGETDVLNVGTRCALAPALVIRGEIALRSAVTGLDLRLLSPVGGGSAVPVARTTPALTTPGSSAFVFQPVKPGRYTMELVRKEDSWTCRADLGPQGPGRRSIAAAWREPVQVTAVVIGTDGKPAGDVAVAAKSPRPRVASRGEGTAIGAWTCAVSSGTATKSDGKGIAHVPLDLQDEALIVAGDWKDPRGLAFAVIDRVPSERLSLKLAAPVRIRARLVDDKDHPVACDAVVTEVPPDISWLNTAVPGATFKTSCDPQGVLVLGPMMPAPQTIEVRPRAGLPLRIPVDPPAPGTVADLGVLRVANGESIHVSVQDEAERPVAAASVTARGVSGIVLTVAGTTGEDGGVELSGLPKSAIVTLDVEAKGYMRARQDELDVGASPFVVRLSRGAGIHGKVRDPDGLPVGGAHVELTGGKEGGPRQVMTEPDGAFELDGVADGAWRVTASAAGFAKSEPAALEIRDHRSADDVSITLTAAKGISGRVVDQTGTPVAGARVRLVTTLSEQDGVPIAEVASGDDGTYRLQAAAPSDGWLVATKDGFGPCVVRGSDAAARADEIRLMLTEPASLVVHLGRGARTSRRLVVKDGAGIEKSVPAGGAYDFSFTDLAPGPGTARFGGGVPHDVALAARQTAEVTLEATAAVEGQVTFEGAPTPRAHVTAVQLVKDGLMIADNGSFTDDHGRYRIDGLSAGSYRIAAVAEDGRAETTAEFAEGETARTDLALRSVRLVATVLDGATNRPVPGIFLAADPGGKTSSGTVGMSSTGDPGELGFEVMIGSNGSLSARTNAVGEARVTLAAPGSYDLSIHDSAYEAWKESVAIGEGTTTKRISLTRKPDQPESKPHVVVSIRTDPPGMSGEIVCARAGSTMSSSPVSDRYDCGQMEPGPAEAIFHVPGYGRGRTAFEVPQTGEVDVEVDVTRGGTVIVPIAQQSTGRPKLADASGYDWAVEKGNTASFAKIEEFPGVGRAWVYRDLPPGVYIATVNGTPRSAVSLAPGGTAIAY